MRKISILLAAFLVSAQCLWAVPADDVKTAFDGYKQALLKHDGSKAAEYLSKRTIGQYQSYLDWALYASEKELAGVPLVQALQALTLRLRIPADQLEKMDGKEVFVYQVEKGWVAKEGLETMNIGKIKVKKDKADAAIYIGSEFTNQWFAFVLEGSSWKIDLADAAPAAEAALRAQLAQSGMNEKSFIRAILQQASGAPVKDDLWNPPLKPEGKSIIGTWEYMNPKNCKETYIYREDGTSTVISGQVTAEERFDFYMQPGPSGRQKFVGETVSQTKGKDCSGKKQNFVGKQYTIYVKFSEDGKEYYIYSNEQSERNLGPFKKVG